MISERLSFADAVDTTPGPTTPVFGPKRAYRTLYE